MRVDEHARDVSPSISYSSIYNTRKQLYVIVIVAVVVPSEINIIYCALLLLLLYIIHPSIPIAIVQIVYVRGIYLKICDGIEADLMENDECELSLLPSSWYSKFAGIIMLFIIIMFGCAGDTHNAHSELEHFGSFFRWFLLQRNYGVMAFHLYINPDATTGCMLCEQY